MGNAVVNLAGKVVNQSGTDKVGLTVQLYEAATWEAGGEPLFSTTTDADGKWAFSDKDITKVWLICVIDGTKKYLIDTRNKIQLTELDLITSLSVDAIYEHTAGAGVTIDGVLLKDGSIQPQVTSGSYTGNVVANRAIPHGLGTTPKVVHILHEGTHNTFIIFGSYGDILMVATNRLDVTIPDATNFYVGNATDYTYSANCSNYNYSWVAIK